MGGTAGGTRTRNGARDGLGGMASCGLACSRCTRGRYASRHKDSAALLVQGPRVHLRRDHLHYARTMLPLYINAGIHQLYLFGASILPSPVRGLTAPRREDSMASLSGLGLASSSSRPPVGKALGFIVWLAVRCAWAYCARVLRPSGELCGGDVGPSDGDSGSALPWASCGRDFG